MIIDEDSLETNGLATCFFSYFFSFFVFSFQVAFVFSIVNYFTVYKFYIERFFLKRVNQLNGSCDTVVELWHPHLSRQWRVRLNASFKLIICLKNPTFAHAIYADITCTLQCFSFLGHNHFFLIWLDNLLVISSRSAMHIVLVSSASV